MSKYLYLVAKHTSIWHNIYILTMIVKATEIVVIPTILAQYGSPITAFSATQGVNTVTAKFRRLRMT